VIALPERMIVNSYLSFSGVLLVSPSPRLGSIHKVVQSTGITLHEVEVTSSNPPPPSCMGHVKKKKKSPKLGSNPSLGLRAFWVELPTPFA
jgi:hypothetical protein